MHTSQTNQSYNWHTLYKIAAYAAMAVVCIIPIQIVIFSVFPPPESTLGFFELLDEKPFLGLLSLDLLYILNNTLIVLVYLGLFAALRKSNLAWMITAIVLGMIGVAAYYSSTVAFEMLALSKQFTLTDDPELKQQFLSAGHAMLATYKGTAFDVYYVLNAATLLIISRIMFSDKTFSRSTAVWGLISGIFMIIPSTAGMIGLIFSLLSLIPWVIFSILIALKLLKLSKL